MTEARPAVSVGPSVSGASPFPRAVRWGLALIAVDLAVIVFVPLDLWLSYGLRLAVAAVFVGLLVGTRRASLADFGLRRALPGSVRWIAIVCLVVLGAYLLLGTGFVIWVRTQGGSFDPYDFRDFVDIPSMKTFLLSALVCAPVVEEVLFRGIAVAALWSLTSRRWAILLSGPLFWGLHVAYWPSNAIMVHYAFAGWILAWAYTRWRSLWVPALLHLLGNVMMGADDALWMFAPEFVHKLLVSGW